MLDSFLTHNGWFRGDLMAIHQGLDDAEQAELSADFPRLRLATPPEPLLAALEALAAAQPHLANRIARFHSLSSFWLEDKGAILFCDSDLVFTGDILPIFDHTGDLLAAPDRAMLQGNRRDPETMEEQKGEGRGNAHRSFNAGLMVLGKALRTDENRSAILGELAGDFWSDLRSDHTDQALLYRLFGDAVTLLDQRFNRLVGHAASLRGVADLPLDEARVLHFNGAAKPWRLERHAAMAAQNAQYIAALRMWFEAHHRFLTKRHFASHLGRRD